MPSEEVSTDLTQQIAQTASEPASASGDSSSVTQQPLPDLIEAAKFLASQSAAQAGHHGVQIRRFVTPGALG